MRTSDSCKQAFLGIIKEILQCIDIAIWKQV